MCYYSYFGTSSSLNPKYSSFFPHSQKGAFKVNLFISISSSIGIFIIFYARKSTKKTWVEIPPHPLPIQLGNTLSQYDYG